MDTDIREQIEQSFGEGPALLPVERHLEAGRRALRRRRAVSALAACGVVVVAGASYALATAGSPQETGGPPIAVEPTRTAAPTESPSAAAWEGDDPVRYLGGQLEIRPGTTVHERLPNPFAYDPPDQSVALDLTYAGQRMWVLAEHKNGRVSYLSSEPSNGWASFGDWVADQVGTAQPGDDGWPETVRLDGDGEVVAAAGARIVQRTDAPDLGASFAAPGEPTGAAVVTVGGDDQSYFVVWRVIDGELDVITTPPRDVVGATFEELLTYARAQYASGEGLR